MPMTDNSERQKIEAAAGRLLAGKPLRSTGELTVVQLAAEAGLKRWKLTHQHTDLMHSFQAAARQLNGESPLITSWRTRAAELEESNRQLRARNEELEATVQTYAEVIADLSAVINQPADRGLASVVPIR